MSTIRDKIGFSPLAHAVMGGHLEIASLIVGHPSWRPVIDAENPNHRDNLLKLKPRQNADAMKEFIGYRL